MNWEGPYCLHSACETEIVSSRVTLLRSYLWLANPGRLSLRETSDLLESVSVPQRLLFRLLLPAIVGLLVGFLALAWTVTAESTLPVAVVCLVAPGLKLAELIMPASHESLAWTFGWFLRIAIGVNTIFYFAIFALLAYLVDRPRSTQSGRG